MGDDPVILVDTDVLIAHLRGVPQARDWMLDARSRTKLVISVVTVAELTGGMRSAERSDVWRLLAALDAVPVTELIARRAGDFAREYRRSHSGIDTTDYLIAATAEAMSAPLASLNVKHFPMFAGLERPFRI